MSVTTADLAALVDRLADLETALTHLYDSNTADKRLLGLENVANAARAIFN